MFPNVRRDFWPRGENKKSLVNIITKLYGLKYFPGRPPSESCDSQSRYFAQPSEKVLTYLIIKQVECHSDRCLLYSLSPEVITSIVIKEKAWPPFIWSPGFCFVY